MFLFHQVVNFSLCETYIYQRKQRRAFNGNNIILNKKTDEKKLKERIKKFSFVLLFNVCQFGGEGTNVFLLIVKLCTCSHSAYTCTDVKFLAKNKKTKKTQFSWVAIWHSWYSVRCCAKGYSRICSRAKNYEKLKRIFFHLWTWKVHLLLSSFFFFSKYGLVQLYCFICYKRGISGLTTLNI